MIDKYYIKERTMLIAYTLVVFMLGMVIGIALDHLFP